MIGFTGVCKYIIGGGGGGDGGGGDDGGGDGAAGGSPLKNITMKIIEIPSALAITNCAIIGAIIRVCIHFIFHRLLPLRRNRVEAK